MNIWWLTAIAAAAVLAGFCMGRVTARDGGETEDDGQEKQPGGKRAREKQGGGSYAGSVGSPVSGQVENMQEGERARVIIRPAEDKIYAPAGGKVTKLFPMGNALLFHTEFGAELYIQAGDSGDELLGKYFRPRVVQNEIVGKGKLLLEFDRRGLEAEGASSQVAVAVEAGTCENDVCAFSGEYVRTGEEILRVKPGQTEASGIRRG